MYFYAHICIVLNRYFLRRIRDTVFKNVWVFDSPKVQKCLKGLCFRLAYTSKSLG